MRRYGQRIVGGQAYLGLIVGQAYKIPHPQKILYLPHKQGKQHPLKRMRLGCFHISGKHSRTRKFQNRPEISSSSHGEPRRKNNIQPTFKYIAKWFAFSKQRIDPVQPEINDVLKFLSELYSKGLQYRSLGTAQSALSTFLKICSNININEFEEVSRFMKGAFLDQPA